MVSHRNSTVTKTEVSEKLSDQVDKMTHSVESSSLSSAMPVIAQLDHEQSGYGGKNGDYACSR